MRWEPGDDSDLEDRRGDGPSSAGFGGFGAMRIGLGGLLVLGVLSVVFRTDLISPFLAGGGPSAPVRERAASSPEAAAQEERLKQFTGFVVKNAQDTWTARFSEMGRPYERARLVLFRDVVQSACGTAQSASGPFYCPGDRRAYVDLSFYEELADRFGAAGDFAQAYVLAHEIGHPCRIFSARRRRCGACSARIRRRATNCRCAWSCRRTATQVSGDTRRLNRGGSIPATRRRDCGRRRRLVTIEFSAWPDARFRRSPSLTDLPGSG